MNAIVTGGTRGIGFEIVKTLLKLDIDCLVLSRKTNQQFEDLKGIYGDKLNFFKTDISSNVDRENLLSFIDEKYSNKIDILVNNAGVAPKTRKDMLDIDVEDYDFLMDINLKGTFFLTQQISKLMIENGSGKIINISSMSSYTVSVNRAEYCISKAGVSMMTKLFAVRLAEFNIPVFEIQPGIIETDMTSKVKDKYVKLIDEGLTPVARMGKPRDIANVVKALVENDLIFSTGSVIKADGGFNLQRL